jgi:type 1 fimbria pilin
MKLLIAATCALVLAAAAPAAAQTTNGSTLQNAPNTDFGCEVAPGTALFAPELVLEPHGFPSCTWWSTGSFAVLGDARSGRVPATGTVTRVRVRSGANPAPIRIVVYRSSGRGCCTAVRTTGNLQPAAGRVSEFEVNLPVEKVSGRVPSTGEVIEWTDTIAVSADANSGTLPIHDQGPGTHTPEAAVGNPNVMLSSMTAPQMLPTDGPRVTGRAAPGYEVLLQFDHVPCPTNVYGQPIARAAQTSCGERRLDPITPSPPSLPATPGAPAPAVAPAPPAPPVRPAPPARIAELGGTGVVRARRGRVAIPISCGATVTCRGSVRLTTRARRARPLSSRLQVTVPAGATRTVRVRLSGSGRSLLRRRASAPARFVLDLGTGGIVTRDVTLRR